MKTFTYVHRHRGLESHQLYILEPVVLGNKDQDILLAYHQSAPYIVPA